MTVVLVVVVVLEKVMVSVLAMVLVTEMDNALEISVVTLVVRTCDMYRHLLHLKAYSSSPVLIQPRLEILKGRKRVIRHICLSTMLSHKDEMHSTVGQFFEV